MLEFATLAEVLVHLSSKTGDKSVIDWAVMKAVDLRTATGNALYFVPEHLPCMIINLPVPLNIGITKTACAEVQAMFSKHFLQFMEVSETGLMTAGFGNDPYLGSVASVYLEFGRALERLIEKK